MRKYFNISNFIFENKKKLNSNFSNVFKSYSKVLWTKCELIVSGACQYNTLYANWCININSNNFQNSASKTFERSVLRLTSNCLTAVRNEGYFLQASSMISVASEKSLIYEVYNLRNGPFLTKMSATWGQSSLENH